MFRIPTLGELVDQVRSAFRSELPGSDAWLEPNNVTVTAKVLGGELSQIHGRLDYIARQKFALTADSENLDRHAQEIGLARLPASTADGVVVFATTAATAVVDGAIVQRADGVTYRITRAGTIGGTGTLALPAEAVSAGRAGNAVANAALTLVSGVTGTATAAVGAAGFTGGADVEDDEALRARVLFRKRNPPHGGSAADYVLWAGAVPGVSRVFVERLWNGPGTVRIFPLADDTNSSGIPSAQLVADVAAALEGLRPAGASVTVQAPTAYPIAVEISGLLPSTVAVREAVLAELRDAVRRESRVAGSDQPVSALPFLATPAVFSRSWLWQAVANAAGESRHVLTAPGADITIPAGSIATLGTVSFT
jgi:uncharacterized phage protein gp47/JayE